jgi:TPR repeat protein
MALASCLAFGQADNADALFDQGFTKYQTSAAEQGKADGFRQMKAAADLGHLRAQLIVGLVQTFYEGPLRNPVAGIQYLRKAADRASPDGLYYLALAHERGTGTDRNTGEAVRLYAKAAALGQLEAQTNLGTALLSGNGVAADPGQGVLWLRRAADAGVAMAQQNLGVLYYQGKGVGKEYLESFKYLKLSALRGNDSAARLLAELRKSLSEDQIAEGERRVAGFRQTAPWRDLAPAISANLPAQSESAGHATTMAAQRAEAAAAAKPLPSVATQAVSTGESLMQPGDEAKAINREPPMTRAEVEAAIAGMSVRRGRSGSTNAPRSPAR